MKREIITFKRILSTKFGPISIEGLKISSDQLVVEGVPSRLEGRLTAAGDDTIEFRLEWKTPQPCNCGIDHDVTWNSKHALVVHDELLQQLKRSNERRSQEAGER